MAKKGKNTNTCFKENNNEATLEIGTNSTTTLRGKGGIKMDGWQLGNPIRTLYIIPEDSNMCHISVNKKTCFLSLKLN